MKPEKIDSAHNAKLQSNDDGVSSIDVHREFRGHDSFVDVVAYSPDGAIFFADHFVFSPDGRYVVASGHGGNPANRDTATGRELSKGKAGGLE